MAVDTKLIEGAYRANAPVVVKPGLAEGLTSLGETVAKSNIEAAEKEKEEEENLLAKEEEKHNKTSEDYDAYMSVMMDGSDLESEELGKFHDYLSSRKQEYIDASPKEQAIMRKELDTMYEDYESFENLKETFAGLDGSSEVSEYFTHSQQGSALIKLLSEPSKYMQPVNGRLKFKVGGKNMSISDIKKLVDSGIKDTAFRTNLQDLENGLANYKKQYPETTSQEAAIQVKRKISDYILSSKKIGSIMNDDLIPGVNFKKDLMKVLKNKTYGDLGITKDILDKTGFVDDDKLTDKEILNIVNYISSTEGGKDLLIDYYTEAVRGRVYGDDKVYGQVIKNSTNTGNTNTNKDYNSSATEETTGKRKGRSYSRP